MVCKVVNELVCDEVLGEDVLSVLVEHKQLLCFWLDDLIPEKLDVTEFVFIKSGFLLVSLVYISYIILNQSHNILLITLTLFI